MEPLKVLPWVMLALAILTALVWVIWLCEPVAADPPPEIDADTADAVIAESAVLFTERAACQLASASTPMEWHQEDQMRADLYRFGWHVLLRYHRHLAEPSAKIEPSAPDTNH